MFNRILVVCIGNICRSPTGEALLQQAFPNKEIASAGLAAVVGFGADDQAQKIAKQYGIDLSKHRAKQLTASMCRSYDLILVMEKSHLSAISNLAPEARGKTMLFGQWLPEPEIGDPYMQSDEVFLYTYQRLAQATQKWINKLR